MGKNSKKIMTHGSIYLLGNIIMRCVSFVMLPIYTRFLTPADYGTVELLSMVLDFVGILLGLRIGQAIFRYYSQYETNNDKFEVITTSLYLVGTLNIIGFLLIFIFVEPLSFAVFGNYSTANYLLLFSLTLIIQGLVEVPMTFIRAQQRPWLFVMFSTIKLILQLSLNIYLVVIKELHVAGVIFSAVISTGIMATILSIYTFSITGFKGTLEKAKQLVSFSLPMMLTSLVAFYITFGDRYFLRIISGLGDVGIYSLGYKFGFLLYFVITGPFFNIWDSEKYKIQHKKNAKEFYQQTFLVLSTIVLLFATGVSLFARNLLQVMSDASFWPAYKIVPIIMAAYVTNAWTEYVCFGLLLKQKTIELTYGAIIAAGVVTLLYVTLIPRYGTYGAAWASFVAFSVRCMWVHWRSKKHYDMQLPWGRVYRGVAICSGAILFSFFGPAPLILSLCYNSFILLLVIGSFLALPILPLANRKWLLEKIRHPTKLPSAIQSLYKGG